MLNGIDGPSTEMYVFASGDEQANPQVAGTVRAPDLAMQRPPLAAARLRCANARTRGTVAVSGILGCMPGQELVDCLTDQT